jgi:hypothetical protein
MTMAGAWRWGSRAALASASLLVAVAVLMLSWSCSPGRRGASGQGATGVGRPADHTKDQHGVLHKPGYKRPVESGCPACHGANLTGSGSAPSCFKCHAKKWRP